MDQFTHARVIVLAGQGLCVEELAARCAGPHWDVAAYSDAYAAAADLLRAAHTVLVFAPASIRPWQKPLILMARRRGIPVLACGSNGLAEAEKSYVRVVRPEDLGEFITACLAGKLEEPTEQQAAAPPSARPQDQHTEEVAGVEEEEEEEEAQQPPTPRPAQDEAGRQGQEPTPEQPEKTDGGEGPKRAAAEGPEPIEPSASQLLTPDEIAALLKSDHE